MISPLMTSIIRNGRVNTDPQRPCDLCGVVQSYLWGEETPERCRTVVCFNCGLIYASPQPSPAELDILNLENPGDPGSLASAPSGVLDEKDLRAEEGVARWAAKLIERFTPVEGRRVLSLRCLSGAVAAALREKGARVYGIDPFETNIRHARRARGLSDTLVIPMSRFHELALPWDAQFDVIEGLSVHVLAHVMHPRPLLARIFDLLKPGGYVFLDEKDTLLPTERYDDFVLDTGRAHQYFLTRQTTASYVRSVGFQLLECEIDEERASSHHHITVAAQKPHGERATIDTPRWYGNGAAGKKILQQLKQCAWTAWLKWQRRRFNLRVRQLLARVPGLRQAWRRTRHLLR